MQDYTQRMNDTTIVIDTAARQQISEYAVFERAFRSWFGEAAVDAELAREFAGYLNRGRVPHWVRHYCRCGCDDGGGPHIRLAMAAREAGGARCIAVGAYLVACLAAACGLMLFY